MQRNQLSMNQSFSLAKFIRANKERLEKTGYARAATLISQEIGFTVTASNVQAVCEAAGLKVEVAANRNVNIKHGDRVRVLASAFENFLLANKLPVPADVHAIASGKPTKGEQISLPTA